MKLSISNERYSGKMLSKQNFERIFPVNESAGSPLGKRKASTPSPVCSMPDNKRECFSKSLVFMASTAFFFTTIPAFYYESPIGILRVFEFLGMAIFVFAIFLNSGCFFRVRDYILCMLVMLVAHFIPLWIVLMTDPLPVYWNTVIGMPLSMVLTCVFLYVFSRRERLFLKACKCALYVHLAFFYVQFIARFGLGVTLDYLTFMGLEQRMIGAKINGDLGMRCAGLTSEPAAFALVAMTLLAIVCWGSEKTPWKLLSATILAVLFSFSAMGYFYLSAFFFCFFGPQIKSPKIWIGIVVSALVIAVAAMLIVPEQVNITYEKLKNFQENPSYRARVGGFFSYVCEDFSGALRGNGLGLPKEITLSDGDFVKAGSTYSTIFLSCGLLLGGLAFFSIWRTLRKSAVPILACVFVFALFMGTHTPSQLFFWTLVFGMALVCRSRIRNTRNGTCVGRERSSIATSALKSGFFRQREMHCSGHPARADAGSDAGNRI